MSKGTYSHSNRHRMHEKRITRDLTKAKVSKFNFLDDELQVTNSDELAVHVYKGLSEMRFKQIIELEDENHELRKDKERLDFLLNRAYAIQINQGDIVSSREKIDEAINFANQFTL